MYISICFEYGIKHVLSHNSSLCSCLINMQCNLKCNSEEIMNGKYLLHSLVEPQDYVDFI